MRIAGPVDLAPAFAIFIAAALVLFVMASQGLLYRLSERGR